MFWKKKNKDKLKTADKVLTGLIIGSVVASVFWVATKTKKWQEVTREVKWVASSTGKKCLGLFWRVLAKTAGILSKNKK